MKGGELVKIRIEISDCEEEEIVIRCSEKTAYIDVIEAQIKKLVGTSGGREMVLYSSGAEYYIPFGEILYFESSDGKVYAHTRRSIYTADQKLFELEQSLPPNFIRVAKSTIANIDLIVSLRREVVGNGEIYFKSSEKKTYFSRSYYKSLREKIQEMRLG